jgi:hypothetical protein
MKNLKRSLLMVAVVALIFAFSSVVDVKPASAAATFSVTCSNVVLRITGAPAGTRYDLLVFIAETGFVQLLPSQPVDANGNLTLSINFPQVKDGTLIYADTWQFLPTIPTFASISKNCGFEGFPMPSGFVLAEITCDVTVFQLPNPDFPTSAKLKNGQTWFANPKSVPAQISTFYNEWTEVHVAGPRTGYIPTVCVKFITGR